MDFILGKVTQQAMNYAIRSGVSLTAAYAVQQSHKLLRSAPQSTVRNELLIQQQRLDHKTSIIAPAIDMIELIAARGNTSLESAVALTRELRYEIQSIGQRMAKTATMSESVMSRGSRASTSARAQVELEMQLIVSDIKKLLERIEDAVPLINLAITTSGATLSTQLPSTVSPSRLLQASTFLTAGDTQYVMSPHKAVQIGPTFNLTVYMLFAGHNRPTNEEEIRETTWKEVIHKARVKLRRVPMDVVVDTGSGSEAIPSVEITSSGMDSNAEENSRIPAAARSDEFAYQLMVIEDFDDDRVHDFDDEEAQPGPFDDVQLAGIREMIPVHEVSKIFYADTSKVLNISPESENHHPVLLLKRDVNAIPPRRMVERENLLTGDHNNSDQSPQDGQSDKEYVRQDHADRDDDPWRLPPSLDPEWIAFEVYQEVEPDDTESEPDTDSANKNNSTSHLTATFSNLDISSSTSPDKSLIQSQASIQSRSSMPTSAPPPWVNQIRTSLSLLELLLRLTSLQQFQQQSHLSISDELLNFFLEESASTGAGGDENHRQAVRADARRRVGWDPYNESPLKRRGEEYQQYGGRPYQEFFDADSGTPIGSPNLGPSRGRRYDNGTWGSPASGAQTRSMTGMNSDVAASPSPNPGPSTPGTKGRTEWMRRQNQDGDRRGSPLRQNTNKDETAAKDEGLGTSPAMSSGGKQPQQEH